MVFCRNYFLLNGVLWWVIGTLCSLSLAASTKNSQHFIQSDLYYAPRSRIDRIEDYTRLPRVIAFMVREYEGLGYVHAVRISDPISAMCILPGNRIALATTRGHMAICNYFTLKSTCIWNANQKYISKIQFSSTSSKPTDERIISTDAVADIVKIWNGLGEQLHMSDMRSFYTYHPCLSHPCSFDPVTQSMTYVSHKIAAFVRNSNSPFAIQRKDCEHVILMGSTSPFVAGYRSGALEVRSLSARRMAWKRVVLNLNHKKACAVTALFKLDRNTAAVGFQNGWVEIWNIINGALQKRWRAHGDQVTNIALHNNHKLITTTQNYMVIWKLPACEKIFEMPCSTPIIAIATSNCDNRGIQYLILCCRDQPVEVFEF